MPVLSPSAGPDVLDIRKLYGQADVFTYDPGFTSTAACESKITFIDGGKGELLHRGYPIEQLAEKSNFLETVFSLFMVSYYGDEFQEEVRGKMFVYHRPRGETMLDFGSLLRNDHPDAILLKQNQMPSEFTIDNQKFVKIVRVKPLYDFNHRRKDASFHYSNKTNLGFLIFEEELERGAVHGCI